MDVRVISTTPLSLLLRVLNNGVALLVNSPGGTQRILNSNKLRINDVAVVLLTSGHPYFCEGLSGLLQTICNNGTPVDVLVLASDDRILQPLSLFNSLAHADYWSGATCIVSATAPTKAVPPYTISGHFLGTGAPCFYTITYETARRKMDKQKIKSMQLTAPQCKDLAAGFPVTGGDGEAIAPEDVSTVVVTRHTVIIMDTYYQEYTDKIVQEVQLLVETGGLYLIYASEKYRSALDSLVQLQTKSVQLVCCADSASIGTLVSPGLAAAYNDFICLRRLWNVLVPNALLPTLDSCNTVETPILTQFAFSGNDVVQKILPGQLSALTAPISELDAYTYYANLLNGHAGYANNGKPAPPLSIDTPGLLFLGTGASVPSKYRNVSGYLIIDCLGQVVCVDPGEGTLQLLEWVTTAEMAARIIAGLRVIAVTHSHADHYLGIASLVCRYLYVTASTMQQQQQQPLIIFADKLEIMYLLKSLSVLGKEYAEEAVLRLHFIDKDDYGHIGRLLSLSDISKEGGGDKPDGAKNSLRILCVPSDHITNSVSIFLQDTLLGTAVGISGDTRPCTSLVRGAGLASDSGRYFLVSVHEATFAASEQELAISKKHSTVDEAAEQFRQMKADVGVFTHFSQRYTKTIPELTERSSIDTDAAPSESPRLYAVDLFWIPFTQQTAEGSRDKAPMGDASMVLKLTHSWSNLAAALENLYGIAASMLKH